MRNGWPPPPPQSWPSTTSLGPALSPVPSQAEQHRVFEPSALLCPSASSPRLHAEARNSYLNQNLGSSPNMTTIRPLTSSFCPASCAKSSSSASSHGTTPYTGPNPNTGPDQNPGPRLGGPGSRSGQNTAAPSSSPPPPPPPSSGGITSKRSP